MADGWKMRDIDEMDFTGYLRVRLWQAKKDYKRRHPPPKKRFIDEIWPMGGQ